MSYFVRCPDCWISDDLDELSWLLWANYRWTSRGVRLSALIGSGRYPESAENEIYSQR